MRKVGIIALVKKRLHTVVDEEASICGRVDAWKHALPSLEKLNAHVAILEISHCASLGSSHFKEQILL